MEEYNHIYITHGEGNGPKILSCLPKRAEETGWQRGYGKHDGTGYKFEPPLTKEEILDITAKLIDCDGVLHYRVSSKGI